MLAPDATLLALNRLMPPFIKATSSNAISTRVSIDRLVLGSIPDIGFAGDTGLHGPKRYNWHQLVGSLQVHAFPAAGADRREGARRAAGPGDPQPDRTWDEFAVVAATARAASRLRRRSKSRTAPMPARPAACRGAAMIDEHRRRRRQTSSGPATAARAWLSARRPAAHPGHREPRICSSAPCG